MTALPMSVVSPASSRHPAEQAAAANASPPASAGRQRAEDKARGKQPGRQGQLSLPEGSEQAGSQCSALSPMPASKPPDTRYRASKRSAQNALHAEGYSPVSGARRYKMHLIGLHSATEPEWSFAHSRGLCLHTLGSAACTLPYALLHTISQQCRVCAGSLATAGKAECR